MDRVSLAAAIAAALASDKATRILWRDPIAAFGAPGIDAVFEWSGDGEMGAFAVRVIEAAARHGAQKEAISGLRTIRSIGATRFVRGDASDALARLQPGNTMPTAAVEAIPASGGLDWPGFQRNDFGNVAGTTWRRRRDRTSLIPLLLRPLRELDSGFSSYPIYAVPEIQIADHDRYEQGAEHEQGWRASKLVIYAHGDDLRAAAHVAVGYWVEKGTGTDKFGPVDRALWDWPRVMELLADPIDTAALQATMDRHQMSIGDYRGGRFGHPGDDIGFVGRIEEGDLVLRNGDHEELGRGWPALRQILENLPDTRWFGFHIWRQWAAAEAIEANHPFAVKSMLPVLLDLATLYLAVISGPRAISWSQQPPQSP